MFSSPSVVVHGLEHVRTALRPGLKVNLLSAPAAASFAGCAWWRALMEAARAEFPGNTMASEWTDTLDCGAAPGYAMSALRLGQRMIILDPACPGFAAVAATAAGLGAVTQAERPACLDLAVPGADRHLRAWLIGGGGGAG